MMQQPGVSREKKAKTNKGSIGPFRVIAMSNSVTIPQDIIYNIIEAVSDDRCLLKKCALVSSSFLLPCRKHIFSELRLRVSGNQACQTLHQFLVENPVVQSFVRSITVVKHSNPTRSFVSNGNYTSLIAILRLSFCCLESSLSVIWSPLSTR